MSTQDPGSTTQLCRTCRGLDFEALVHGETVEHQPTFQALDAAALAGCGLCQVFHATVLDYQPKYNPGEERTMTLRETKQDQSTDHAEESTALSEGLDLEQGPYMIFRHNYQYRDILEEVHRRGVACLGYAREVDENSRECPKCNICSMSNQHPTVVGRLVPEEPDLAIIKGWIEDCAERHEECGAVEDKPLPTRLIYVGQHKSSDPCLVETDGLYGKYIALLYCWGQFQPFITERHTYADRIKHISFQSLPTLFQDAVTVVRRLGFDYLWIDCVCIIQGDRQDWEIECSKMGAVYENAVLTIAAPGASSSAGTLLHHRPFPVAPAVLVGCDSDLAVCVSKAHNNAFKRIEERENPLSKRGWCVQERLLTPRIVYFGTELLYFECMVTEYSENVRISNPSSLWRSYLGHWDNPVRKGQASFNEPDSNPHFSWTALIETYSKCQLTYQRDRLPALSGLARRFQRNTQETYLAGLWKGDLCEQLGWMASPRTLPQRSSHERKAPSWSWASVEYGVFWDFDEGVGTPALDFLREEIVPLGYDEFGEVQSGILEVRGCLKTFTIGHKTEPLGSFYTFSDSLADFMVLYHPDFDQSQHLNMKVTCLLLGGGEGPRWSAIALEPLLDRPGTYRGVGFVSSVEANVGWDLNNKEIVILI